MGTRSVANLSRGALRLRLVAVCQSSLLAAALVMAAPYYAVAALPSGYLELEYIKGNGSDARIAIDDYTPTPNDDKIEAVVSFPAGTLNAGQCVWCARGNYQERTWSLFMDNSGGYKFRFDYGNNDAGTYLTPALSTDVKYTVTADGPAFTWSGGNGQTHTRITDYTAGGYLMLFASYVNGGYDSPGSHGKFKLYSCKVWRSGTLIHDLVPAERESDSNKGFYDMAVGKFYQGTGTFSGEYAAPGETIDASVVLDADRTVSGVLTVESGVVVDLAGHRLTVGGLAGGGEITDTSTGDAPGELWLDVAGTAANSTVALTGNLTLVKAGVGTFTASKASQTYTGGTVVTNGTLTCAVSSWSNPFGARYTNVTVYDNGVFDCAGYDNTRYVFVLAGGVLKSDHKIQGNEDMSSYSYSTRYYQLSKVRLEKDSSIDFPYSYGFSSEDSKLDLGGHTLTVAIGDRQYLQLCDLTVTNGTLAIQAHSRGYGVLCYSALDNPSEVALNAINANIRLSGALKTYQSNQSVTPIIKLGDFEDVSPSDPGRQITGIRNNIEIFGTYKPTSAYFTGCVMQDGSTLDLSEKSGAWSTTSSASADNTVIFADNATIAVKIGNRHVPSGTRVISWVAPPSNLDSLKFVRGDSDRGYSVIKREDGVYLRQGFVILVK